MRRRPVSLALATLASALACGTREEPTRPTAPTTRPTVPAAPAPAPAPTPSPAAPPAFVMHPVQEGETLSDIAHAYGVTVQVLMNANGLDPDDVRRLPKNAPLKVPGANAVVDVSTAAERAEKPEVLPPLTDGAYHRLSPGESLWTLADAYDVPIEKIMERNGLTDDDLRQLRAGRAYVIPGLKPSQIKAPAAGAAPTKRKGIHYTMAPGETIWDIARAFGVSVAEIMATNALKESDVPTLRDGTKLFLPGVEQDKAGRVRRPERAGARRATAYARRLGLGTMRAAGLLLHGRVDKRWIKAAGGGKNLPGIVKWPVANGWYVRGYGSGEGGYHLATDIMGRIGWNVRAAAPGIVGYSGDKVRGFGNMVMVVHPGGWVTLYAHNSVNFVVAGDRVDRGSILAEVGSTGRSTGPHVHFELIHEGKNCDPSSLFRPGIRHRSGKLSKIPPQSWTRADERPKGLRCAPRRRHPTAKSVLDENPDTDAEKEE
jgi:murein DD-endopeptidase MepM/ murein hydrolase activator NlpD